MATSTCHNYLTPENCNQRFYHANGQQKIDPPPSVFDRMDPKHRNMRKGDNPEILAALSRHVIASRHNHLNEELQQCKAGAEQGKGASCAFTPCIGCDENGVEQLDDTTGDNSDRNDTSKSIININNMYSNRARKADKGIPQTLTNRAHMQVQQQFSNAGTGADADISVHQRGYDSPAYWEGGEDHGQRQQNIFNRYVQRNARTCNEFGNQCGLMPETTGTGDNRVLGLPSLDEQRQNVITGIYNTFNPNTAFANALAIQRVPSWVPNTGAANNPNITAHRNNPKSDKRTLGYED